VHACTRTERHVLRRECARLAMVFDHYMVSNISLQKICWCEDIDGAARVLAGGARGIAHWPRLTLDAARPEQTRHVCARLILSLHIFVCSDDHECRVCSPHFSCMRVSVHLGQQCIASSCKSALRCMVELVMPMEHRVLLPSELIGCDVQCARGRDHGGSGRPL
jgi:hypothetical protein